MSSLCSDEDIIPPRLPTGSHCQWFPSQRHHSWKSDPDVWWVKCFSSVRHLIFSYPAFYSNYLLHQSVGTFNRFIRLDQSTFNFYSYNYNTSMFLCTATSKLKQWDKSCLKATVCWPAAFRPTLKSEHFPEGLYVRTQMSQSIASSRTFPARPLFKFPAHVRAQQDNDISNQLEEYKYLRMKKKCHVTSNFHILSFHNDVFIRLYVI